MEPVFSVIVPCYNHGEFLRRNIKSVAQIDIAVTELIIVDDGSTDEKTIKELDALEQEGYRIIRQSNAGPGAARNNGISIAKGKYIIPLDADDMIRKEYVQEAYKVFEAKPSIHIVYSNFKRFGDSDTVERYTSFNLQDLMLTNSIGSCAIYRKSAWEAVSGYDENLRKGYSWEDWDFWITLACHHFNFLHLDMVGYDYYYKNVSRERDFLKDRIKVNRIIDYFEEKHQGFYNPKAIHDNLIFQVKSSPVGMLGKIILAAYFPGLYQKALKKGKIRKYLF
jgi:glycosyltransferase involved in cell wall biosynthesis